jgi:hypothetical protein
MEDLKQFEAVWPDEVRAIRASVRGQRARENRELKSQLLIHIRETRKLLREKRSSQKQTDLLLFALHRLVSRTLPAVAATATKNENGNGATRFSRRRELIREFAKSVPRTANETAAHLTKIFRATNSGMVEYDLIHFQKQGLYIPVTEKAGQRPATFKIR